MESLRRFAGVYAAIDRALNLCANGSPSIGGPPPRLDALHDCSDGSVKLSVWVPHVLKLEGVRLATRKLQVGRCVDWVKLQVHDMLTTRTYVLHESSAHDVALPSRIVTDDQDVGTWTRVTWRLASEHGALETLRAALASAVESFWLGRCPDLELHIVNRDGTEAFSLWQPPVFSGESLDQAELLADETALRRAVLRSGSSAARCSAEATTVSGWHFPRGQGAVQCCMHWRPNDAASVAENGEHLSIVRLLSDESFYVSGDRPVHDAFATVAKTWAKEFGMKLTPRNKVDHTSYWLDLPVVNGQAPVSGVLTMAIDSPIFRSAAASTGTRKKYLSAAQHAVGQAVDALASRDILFLSQRRLRRQKFAPSIAQKLSWMLCKIGDENVLNEFASALGVEYARLAADTRAIARRYPLASAVASGAASEDENATSDADGRTPHARVVAKMTAGLTEHLCGQLREACPAAPDANKVASACRARRNLRKTALEKDLLKKRKASAPDDVNDRLSGQDRQKSLSTSRTKHASNVVAMRAERPVGPGSPADEATDIESEWSDSVPGAGYAKEAGGFESDEWSDSAHMLMSPSARAADAADMFEPDDWSDSASDQGGVELLNNDQGEGEWKGEGVSSRFAFGETYWPRDADSDFSSSDSEGGQVDPCMHEAAWSAGLDRS